jgi:hypothetical protein
MRYRLGGVVILERRKIQYVVGVLGVATAAIAAALGGESARYFAATSGVCTAVLGFVHPERRYLRFIGAWRILDIAVLKFKLGKASVDDLIQAVERGETLITESQDKRG